MGKKQNTTYVLQSEKWTELEPGTQKVRIQSKDLNTTYQENQDYFLRQNFVKPKNGGRIEENEEVSVTVLQSEKKQG